ncbi:hypothetical protein BKA56DRAFT_653901 [Ilyonectria sp. MPI-CAGE-AT-0026]|nr:hypothetical protein BKA56DRAFT_653901 [Ilyonectria sp. MPI-CAGE-AT-0026]
MAVGGLNIVVTLYPDPGNMPKFTSLVQELTKAVKNNEPGVLVYYTVTTKGEAGEVQVIFIESYVDQAALDAHLKTPHYLKFKEEAASLFVQPPKPAFGALLAGFAG